MQYLSIVDGTPSRRRMTALTNEIQHAYDTQSLKDPQKRERIQVCHSSIHQVLIGAGLPLSTTKIYGSAANGFGTNKSDLDVTIKVSLRFKEKYSDEILKKVRDILLKSDGNCKAEFIPARIPIVTAFYRGFDIDISYDNETAVDNTKLLRAYGDWEPRLLVLGCFIKKWAKACGICDSPNRYFSSFHWILLTINCLQSIGKKRKNKNHGRVLPFIQSEFWPGPAWQCPWRHYQLPQNPNWSTNKSSVAELFLYFLEFYSNFNFKHQCIFIARPGFKIRKIHEWGQPVVIRSPFFCGNRTYRRLSEEEKHYYRKNYGGKREQNIAEAVTQENLDRTIEVIKITSNQIRGYLQGKEMTDPILKALFNL